ncbi:Peptidyl-prolyl cis-trans isomerase cyp6 [Aphanomyces cochlioides]|nr:Peptidyl-prolyl cis-trans isomerase cyp6 [Aphanomyces cochlioides]
MGDRMRGKDTVFIIYLVAGLSLIVVFFMATMQDNAVSQAAPAASPALLGKEPASEPAPTLASRNWTRQRGRRYVWLDVAIDDVPIGRVTVELYMDIVPKTAENFRALVTGDNAAGVSYKKSKCHRILKGFIVQCGDYEYGKGYGGKSIYGDTFEDEKAGLALKHDKRYILQMANYGPDTNKSQFCFMLGPAPHLNGHHVVFGQVVDGFFVIDEMEASGVQMDQDELTHKVILVDGGEIFD